MSCQADQTTLSRGADVVCVRGDDVYSSSEFFVSFSNFTIKYGESGEDPIFVHVYCNGFQIEGIVAAIDNEGRIYFIEPEGLYSFIPSDLLLREMQLKAETPNFVEFRQEELNLSTSCKVWLWEIYENVCIVDIDGTITLSDVQGYIETVYLGKYTFVHEGIVSILRTMKEFGVQLMFLTARPIEHIHETRGLLAGVVDESGHGHIPESPLFTSQDFVLQALYKEVITGSSASSKSAILQSLREVFIRCGRNSSPFMVGFGNKQSDATAYSSAGIISDYIFIINPWSELKIWDSNGVVMKSFNTYRDPELLSYIEMNFKKRSPLILPVSDCLLVTQPVKDALSLDYILPSSNAL